MPSRLSRSVILATLSSGLLVAVGCSSSQPRVSEPASDRWVINQGGALHCPERDARVERAVASLNRPDLARLKIALLATDRPAAYSWPDGRVYVSRGLVDLLDDAELAAAIAHEFGHLIADGHVPSAPTALTGKPAHTCGGDAEVVADRQAVALLQSAGIDPAALARVLRKVAASPLTDGGTRHQLADRAQLLSAR